eukprot:scaffold5103_cov350-Prasinococcus_capsulatus_cf.AAC.2
MRVGPSIRPLAAPAEIQTGGRERGPPRRAALRSRISKALARTRGQSQRSASLSRSFVRASVAQNARAPRPPQTHTHTHTHSLTHSHTHSHHPRAALTPRPPSLSPSLQASIHQASSGVGGRLGFACCSSAAVQESVGVGRSVGCLFAGLLLLLLLLLVVVVVAWSAAPPGCRCPAPACNQPSSHRTAGGSRSPAPPSPRRREGLARLQEGGRVRAGAARP